MTFKELGVIDPILDAIEELGYETPTPIQEQSIPILLRGDDLLGCAQTGTGKTAAFTIPIIQHLVQTKDNSKGKRSIKALIVTPTRELAIQIGENITNYAKHTAIRNTVIYGGVKQGAQTRILGQGIDILVATPGRLLDLMNQGYVSLSNVRFLVLDEADHMLDMGFIHDIKRILAKVPKRRQSLFFSATMPPSIINLSGEILGNPKKVTINPEQPTAERVKQAVYHVSKKSKSKLLVHLLETQPIDSALVFSRTKHGANKLVKILGRSDIQADAIHGNKSQAARQRALASFKAGETKVLIATDIAARGIDVSGLSLVINYDLPNVAETYVHRIGRTGRAEMSGIALSFCDREERAFLKDIEKLLGKRIPLIAEHPFQGNSESEPEEKTSQPRGGDRNTRGSRGGGDRSKKPKRNDNRKKPSQATSNGDDLAIDINWETGESNVIGGNSGGGANPKGESQAKKRNSGNQSRGQEEAQKGTKPRQENRGNGKNKSRAQSKSQASKSGESPTADGEEASTPRKKRRPNNRRRNDNRSKSTGDGETRENSRSSKPRKPRAPRKPRNTESNGRSQAESKPKVAEKAAEPKKKSWLGRLFGS